MRLELGPPCDATPGDYSEIASFSFRFSIPCSSRQEGTFGHGMERARLGINGAISWYEQGHSFHTVARSGQPSIQDVHSRYGLRFRCKAHPVWVAASMALAHHALSSQGRTMNVFETHTRTRRHRSVTETKSVGDIIRAPFLRGHNHAGKVERQDGRPGLSTSWPIGESLSSRFFDPHDTVPHFSRPERTKLLGARRLRC